MATAPTLFETTNKAASVSALASASAKPDVALLYEQIGRLQMVLAFSKKKLPQ